MNANGWSVLLGIALVANLSLLVALTLRDLAAVPSGGLGAAGVASLVGLACGVVAVVGVVGIVRILSRTRGELRRRDEALTATALTTDAWLWECDLQHRFTYSSASVGDVLGLAPDQVVGISMMDLLYDDASRAEARRIQGSASASSGGWGTVELAWRHRDGRRVWLTGSAVALHDERGRAIGYRGAWHRNSSGADSRRSAAAARRRVTGLLHSGALAVALQPIVDVTTGEMVGVEALARFDDGRSPDEWFRDAQEAGLTRRLDEVAFINALTVLDQIPAPVFVSVNASPELLLDPDFRHRLTTRGAGLDRLVIEITEHVPVADYDDLNAAIAGLRARGVRFAIDDTGAGYSSLNHVLKLKPDIIKLDRELIAHLDDDRARRALVTALVLLALEVGASVTGEGVETPDQLNALTTLGVDHAQGYLLAPPTTERSSWKAWTEHNWLHDPQHPRT